jgi:hypothetical protein
MDILIPLGVAAVYRWISDLVPIFVSCDASLVKREVIQKRERERERERERKEEEKR